MTEKVRVGFIGCGSIARGHACNLAQIEEAEIVALCDVNPEMIDKFKRAAPETTDCPVFDDYRQMLDSVDMDAVEIHTPHTLHFEQALASLKKGVHVLVEKPMVCRVEHARELIAEAEARNRIVLVSYQRHYQPEYLYIKKTIESGELGEVHFISALQCQNWMRSQWGKWRLDPALSGGGQLNDSGSHLLDIILWTTGLSVKEVQAFIDNRGTKVDINSALSLRFNNGAQGSISVVGDAPVGFWEDLTIWGTDGMIFYRNGELMHKRYTGEMLKVMGLPSSNMNPDRNFINAILGKEEVQSPASCGLRVIELTETAWRSAKTGKVEKVRV
ncbi:MAG TPA: Gfo/Idh/MocA family oxidoreductase [Candidatus Latescibacteria bacterium]|nr:Gfo/Idh/MocA family oxidoreductase [Candidatus Latescibacterota bacterium]